MSRPIAGLWTRLGVEHPIIQAPMAGISTPELAAAVSNAGGLGSIAIGAASVTQALGMIHATRALTSRAFNVNVFCHRPAHADAAREAAWLAHLQPLFAEFEARPPASLREIYTSFVVDDAMLAMLLAEKPAVLSFHFGLPPPAYIAALKQAGIVLLATVTNPDEARVAAEAGIDAIVAQGVEAGGHRGVFEPAHDPLIGTLALTRLLSRQSPLPVIAAGGIMDGDGIRSVTTLGAIGAQLGTAFVVCPESAADASYRAALLDPGVRTEITSVISGRPARGIVHRFMREAGASSHPPLPDYPIAYDAGKALNAAARAQGSAQFAAHWAGQAAAMARVMCAAALIAKLAGEMHAA